jgi:hypothetical protein
VKELAGRKSVFLKRAERVGGLIFCFLLLVLIRVMRHTEPCKRPMEMLLIGRGALSVYKAVLQTSMQIETEIIIMLLKLPGLLPTNNQSVPYVEDNRKHFN